MLKPGGLDENEDEKLTSGFFPTQLFFSFRSVVLLFSGPVVGFPAEPDEKQKEIQNNTVSEGKTPARRRAHSERGSRPNAWLSRWPHCLRSAVRYVGGYHGLLSGVTVRPGSVEPHSVVECLYACREGLDFGDLETLGSGMKVRTGRNTQPGFTCGVIFEGLVI